INDHLGDLTGERRQHSLIGSDRVGPAARSGTRLGEQGQPGGLGESRRLRPRTISGDDDARAAQVDLARARAHPSYPHPRAEGDGGLVLAAAIAGDEGLTEGDVHVDRTGRPEGTGCLGEDPGGLVADRRAGTSGGDLHSGDVRAEHVQLIRGLVRTDPAEFVGSVSGDRKQPEPAVAGLQERGVEVRRGRSRGGHHRGGPEPREAEGGEGGDAFVDAYVHLDPSPAFGAGERVGKRGAAGTGAEHDALHAVEDERVHEGSGGLGGRVGGAGHGWLRSSSTSRRTRVRRSFQRWVVPGSAAVRSRSGRREIAPAGRTGRDPPSGTRGRAAVSVVKRLIVASPQAKGSSGSAAASATPAAIPTEDSSAEETTAGRPTCSMISSAARTPPSGCTLTTMMSAASCRATS